MSNKKVSNDEIYPILAELQDKLEGDEGRVWCRASKQFLNRKNPWEESEMETFHSLTGKVRKNFVLSDEVCQIIKDLQPILHTKNETETVHEVLRICRDLALKGKLHVFKEVVIT